MSRCRICDEEYEARELSWDACCYKCVEASADLFEEDDGDIVLVISTDEDTFQPEMDAWNYIFEE